MELVKCNNLCKKFDDKQVLNNINLSIPKGKIIGLLGKNGMGKTTLIKLINDLFNQGFSRNTLSTIKGILTNSMNYSNKNIYTSIFNII